MDESRCSAEDSQSNLRLLKVFCWSSHAEPLHSLPTFLSSCDLLFPQWQWHFITEPIVRSNLYCLLTLGEHKRSQMFAHMCMKMSFIVRVRAAGMVTEWNSISGGTLPLFLPFSLCLYGLSDSWPRGHIPYCAFVPLPIQHYLKPSAAAAQHNHAKIPPVAAKSAFQQVTAVQRNDREREVFSALFPRRRRIVRYSWHAHLQPEFNDRIWSCWNGLVIHKMRDGTPILSLF